MTRTFSSQSTTDQVLEGIDLTGKLALVTGASSGLGVETARALAAKGARPVGYLLGLVWPASVKEEAIAEFAAGLAEDQAQFKIALIGGDTTVHGQKGAPLTISVTMIGTAGAAGMIRRSGAKSGDDVYVSGTIGDAGLGLAALSGAFKPSPANKALLVERYQLPSPRVSLGGALGGHASAAIDISDGLIADAGHIAAQSKVAIDIEAAKLPLSAAARAWLDKQEDANAAFGDIASFGDDYEILFTAPPARRRSIEMAAQVTKTAVARIGSVSRGAGVRLLDADGEAIAIERKGFDHFRR